MESQFKGSLIKIGEIQEISDKFSKRDFVVKTNEEYPQEVIFQIVNDKAKYLDTYNVGDEVELKFNIRGRAWKKDENSETKYFNTLDCWYIKKVGSESAQETEQVAQSIPNNEEEEDDLPF